MGSVSKYQTTVVGAHSVPDWFVTCARHGFCKSRYFLVPCNIVLGG